MVNQSLASITLPSRQVVAGSTSQASATDQFGNPFVATVNWSSTAAAPIDANGVFTASQTGGTFTITGTSGGSTATTSVTVVPTVFSGPAGADTYAVRVSPTNASVDQIFVNTSESSTPTYTIATSQLSA